MTRSVVLLAVFGGMFAGCEQAATPSASTTPTSQPSEQKGDVHIRTPGVNVDVERKGTGRSVDVDVHRTEE
jgi:hypothetical protein